MSNPFSMESALRPSLRQAPVASLSCTQVASYLRNGPHLILLHLSREVGVATLALKRLPDHELVKVLFASQLWADVPVVEDIDRRILDEVERSKDSFRMSAWHANCGTTHCRAGWATTFAGEAGKEMERRFSYDGAGGLIYLKSAGYIPSFYSDTQAALDDMRARCNKE